MIETGCEVSRLRSRNVRSRRPRLYAVRASLGWLSGIEIRDARELRVKESDRIAAVASNLRTMGARVEEREDGLLVPGGQTLHGAEIESHGDHRIAMAFAIAALRAEGETIIHGAEAARISYPEFFEALEKITQR